MTALALFATAAAIALLLPTGAARASAQGPFPGFTGAPGEDNCRHCHTSFRLNESGGTLSVEGFPQTYELGQRYTVTVTLASDSAFRWGFEATALTTEKKRGGKILITDPVRTKKVRGYFLSDRIYVEQRKPGTYTGIRGAVSWTFDWVAPTSDKGPVTLYVSGNAANGNDKPDGDLIYATAATASPAAQ